MCSTSPDPVGTPQTSALRLSRCCLQSWAWPRDEGLCQAEREVLGADCTGLGQDTREASQGNLLELPDSKAYSAQCRGTHGPCLQQPAGVRL